MGRAYSQDLRGGFGNGRYKVLGRWKKDGRDERPSLGGGPKPKLAAHDEALPARVMSKPAATLAELQAWLLAEHNVTKQDYIHAETFVAVRA